MSWCFLSLRLAALRWSCFWRFLGSADMTVPPAAICTPAGQFMLVDRILAPNSFARRRPRPQNAKPPATIPPPEHAAMFSPSRRAFLGASLAGLASAPLFGQSKTAAPSLITGPDDPTFKPDTLFLTWQRDPT